MVFQIFHLISALNSLSSDIYLTHYWPFDNNQLTDVVGGATLTQGSPSTAFTIDRFGNANCALNLNNGYANVPSTYFYFNTPQYSVSVWVRPASTIGQWSRLFDCLSSGSGINEFAIILNQGTNNPSFQVSKTLGASKTATFSSTAWTLATWQLLVVTYDSTNGLKAFINTNPLTLSSAITYTPYNVVRAICYVGKSYSTSDPYSSSFIDDLKFYNTSLTAAHQTELYNQVFLSNKNAYINIT